jgi:hypothetical protein
MRKAVGILVASFCGALCAGEAPLDSAKALEAVQAFVADAAASGKKTEIWLTVLGASQKVELVKSDAKVLSVKVQGNVFAQPWAKISAAEIAGVGKSCVQGDARRALTLADYCIATGLKEKADEALNLAAQLDPKLSEELKARWKLLEGPGVAKPSTPNGEAKTEAAPKATAWGGSLLDRNGKVVREAYAREALDWSLAALHARLGPDFDFYHRDSKSKGEKPPAIYQPPEQFYKTSRNGQGSPWTVGGPPTENPGDYSSTHAQLFYQPDKPNDPGVDRISILDMGHNVFNFKPEPTWWGGSHPEPGVKTPAWAQAGGGQLGAPVALSRGYGMWCNSAIMVFSSGVLASAGTCTSQNTYPCFAFPKGKAPTAVAVTTRNEFALVTVWDFEKLKGQLAVLALDGMHKDGLMSLYCWHEPKPGLPNPGGFRTYKLLGYVDLPGMAAPTGISVYGSAWEQWLHSLEGKNVQAHELDTSDPKVRNTFYDKKQWNYRWCSDAGFAVIISKHEDRVAFVDLQPLFAYYREMYFGPGESYKKTLEVGPDPKQWPPTFEVEPRQQPVVVAVQPTPAPTPTAVICSVRGDEPNVVVALQDGKLAIYKVGGLATAAPAAPGEIQCVGAVNVGRNPCCLAYNKNVGWGTPETLNNTFLVVSRGDRAVQWVRVTGGKGEVIRTLRDARLVDPVFCEMGDTHGTESHVITVCDFKGRKVVNYRFGPVVFHTNASARFPMGPDGKAEFECGGVMEFPGYPYKVCGTNVN